MKPRDKYEKIMQDELNKQGDADKAVLEIVKARVTPRMFADIELVLEESEYTFNYLITDKPKGKYQTEDLYTMNGYWVNQTTDGGYTGDEFAGTVSIPIGNEKYFQFNYSM